jgi:hypothetical protein
MTYTSTAHRGSFARCAVVIHARVHARIGAASESRRSRADDTERAL